MKRWTLLFLTIFVVTSPTFANVKPKLIKTPGGLEIWYVYDKNTPVIALNFLFKGGATADPVGKEGLAVFTAQILSSGTATKEPKDFDEYKQDYGIQLGFSADLDQLGGFLTMLKEHEDKSFALLSECLTQPRLKEDVYVNIMNAMKTALANKAKDPATMASKKMNELLFKGHTYEREPSGTKESMRRITLEDVDVYIKNNLTKDQLLLSVVGNIEEKELSRKLDEIFGKLPAKSKTPAPAYIEPAVQGQTEIIDLAIPQSYILFALPGIHYDDPDFIKAALLLHIMGHQPSSRLYKEIREKRGLAYVVAASNVWRQSTGYIMGMVGTTKDKTKISTELVREQWQKLKKDGITAEELDDAKLYMRNTYPLRFDSSDAISKILLGFQFVKRPITYFQDREKLFNAITLKDMNDFIQKTIHPEKLTFVVVGRPEETIKKPTTK